MRSVAVEDAVPAIHPLADIFPMMRPSEFNDLVASVRANGLREPILRHQDGRVLDGRHRLQACMATGVPPRFRTWQGGDDLVAFLVDINMHRRHLDASQRAMVAARLEGFTWGGVRLPKTQRLQLDPDPTLTRADAAALVNVSERSTASAATVLAHGVTDLTRIVQQGEVSVAAAEAIARRPPADQVDVLARGRTEILQAAKLFKLEDLAAKRARRAEREAHLAGATVAASARLGTRLFNVIYADPPWKQAMWSDLTGGDRAAANHYPVMETEAICALAVPAAKDCALFLWRLANMQDAAAAVVAAWGFTVQSEIVWVKDKVGLGHWARNQHEVLLICTRGDIPAPSPGTQSASVVPAPRGRHSAKPDVFPALIAAMYPTVPKLEMFARMPRPGWAVWGNEATPLEAFAEAAHG